MADSNPLMMSPGGLFNGRYEIVRSIASGGMGAVYEVIHVDTRRRRALKVMLPQLVSNDALRQRFKQEATVVSNVHSQHVVEITDAGVDNATGAPFIVMELLMGHDLQDILKQKGTMKPHQLAELVRQAAMALDRTHAAGIVHRDLKPENLFVTLRDDGTPHLKVLDFGIAKVVADGMKNTNHTATIGTPAFMAPEQIQSKTEIGPASDVYALAQVAYCMLVGEAYFAEEQELAENAFQVIVAVSKGVGETAKARAQRRRGVELSDAIDAWFSRATAVNGADRYPSAGALAKAFTEAVGGTGDLRMSLPDAKAAMSTMEFLSSEQQLPRHTTGGRGVNPSGNTEVAPMGTSAPGVTSGGNTGPQRTISAAVSDLTPKKRSPRWPYAVGALVLVGGGITLARGVLLRDPPKKPAPADEEDTASRKAKVPPSSSSPAAAGTNAGPVVPAGCPDGMARVERATFSMGGNNPASGPVHKVAAGPFCVDKHEVTAKEYGECVTAGKCVARSTASWSGMDDDDRKRHDPRCTFGKSDQAKHPINCIDWADADAYCTWAGKRLPTEAEWELAARGAESRAMPWGGGPPSGKHLNACGLECREELGKGMKSWEVMFNEKDGFGGTAPVGTFPDGASPAGALDMAGNVGEWTADWYLPYELSTSTLEDPKSTKRPDADPRRVVRGGHFMNYAPDTVAPWARSPSPDDKRSATVGVRCVK